MRRWEWMQAVPPEFTGQDAPHWFSVPHSTAWPSLEWKSLGVGLITPVCKLPATT